MSAKPRVYVSRGAPPDSLKELEKVCDVVVRSEQKFISKQEMMEKAKGFDALFIHPPDRIDAEVLDAIGMLFIC